MRPALPLVALLLGLIVAPHHPRAQTLGSGYCAQVEGSAGAEAARLFAPTAFTTISAANLFDNTSLAGPVRTLALRTQAGLSYSVSNLVRGFQLKNRASAECRRYRAEQSLEAALEAGPALGARAALEARAAFLEEMMPEAQKRVDALKADVEARRATTEELAIAQLRLDGLRKLGSDTHTDLRRMAARSAPPPPEALPVLIRAYRDADADMESSAGGMRLTESWDLRLQGGYDAIQGLDSTYPLFGSATLSYNLGHLFQLAPNAEARAGRTRSLTEDVGSVERKIALLTKDLEQSRNAEIARLQELDALVSDLEQRLQQAETLQTSIVRRYNDYLFFELARLKAEQVYLRAHAQEAAAFLGVAGP